MLWSAGALGLSSVAAFLCVLSLELSPSRRYFYLTTSLVLFGGCVLLASWPHSRGDGKTYARPKRRLGEKQSREGLDTCMREKKPIRVVSP